MTRMRLMLVDILKAGMLKQMAVTVVLWTCSLVS